MSLNQEYVTLITNAFQPVAFDLERHQPFFELWEEVAFEKHDFITRAGEVERYFHIVIEGVQCIYIMDTEGNKQVIGFSFDGSFSGVYDAFVKQKASSYFIESLTPSRLLRINLNQYRSIFDNYPEFERWGRIVHLELFIGRVEREIELITKSAKERFEDFMARCPRQLNQIPQKYLASYINMTPETFSRLRKERE